MIGKALTIAALLGFGLSKQLYDSVRSDVTIYTQLNFEKQVSKNRDKGISIVHFYKDSGKYADVKQNNHNYFCLDGKS